MTKKWLGYILGDFFSQQTHLATLSFEKTGFGAA
jgi:hypothetical protein